MWIRGIRGSNELTVNNLGYSSTKMVGNIRPFQGRRYGEAFTPGFRQGLLELGLSKARATFTASYVYIACKAMLMADGL